MDIGGAYTSGDHRGVCLWNIFHIGHFFKTKKNESTDYVEIKLKFGKIR